MALEMPITLAKMVSEMADEPVTGERGYNPHADSPDDPWPASAGVEKQCQRHLMKHPCALEKLVKRVMSHFGLYFESRRVF